MSSKCGKCGTEKQIVHSGVDALLLQVLEKIGAICYPCANKDRQEKND